MFDNVLLEIDDRIAILSINRPKALNALNQATLRDIGAALTHIEAEKAADVLIITGAGPKSFVAGADIAEMKDMTQAQAREFAWVGQNLFKRLQSTPMPVIAAVNGFALGGGCELAMACDVILASEKARFGQPEVNLGIIPGFGGTQRMARLVGPQWAKYLCMSGDLIDAKEALRIGLVARVYPPEELLGAARKLASTIAGKGLIAVGLAKQAINEGLGLPLDKGLEIEVDKFVEGFGSEDRKEGMQAFLEKRKPEFKGR